MKTILTIAALGAFFLTTPALAAGTTFATRSAAVSYSDLNLATDAGIRELDRRIGAAARDACGTPSSADATGLRKVRSCRAAAIGQVSAQRDRAIEAARSSAPSATSAN